jgi:GNAT superfamily N-acetyltransferase
MRTEVVDAFTAGRYTDAAELIFEYMAMTEVESGQPAPASLDQLHPLLAAECRSLELTYAPPGVLLLACVADMAIGCVGLKYLPSLDSCELKRLYVRPSHRGHGAARSLLLAAHAHAYRAEVSHILLDVMPSRSQVIEFYRRAGYRDAEPYRDRQPSMVVLRRAVQPTDAAPVG